MLDVHGDRDKAGEEISEGRRLCPPTLDHTRVSPRSWLTARGAWSAGHALQPPPGQDSQTQRCGRQWTNYFYTVLSIIIHRLNRQLYVDACACSLLLPGHWVLDARSHGASGPLAGFWMRACVLPLPGWLPPRRHCLGSGWLLRWLDTGWVAV